MTGGGRGGGPELSLDGVGRVEDETEEVPVVCKTGFAVVELETVLSTTELGSTSMSELLAEARACLEKSREVEDVGLLRTVCGDFSISTM